MTEKSEWAEDYVKKRLEKKTRHKFDKKKKLRIGKKENGEPKKHKFDLVSDDETIIVEVKSGKGKVGKKGFWNNAGVSACFQDCYFLTKTRAKSKILALTDWKMYEHFKKESDGVIKKDGIDVRYFGRKKAKK